MTSIRPENLVMTHASGPPASSLPHPPVYLLPDEEPRIVYLVGRQITIEKLQSPSEVFSNSSGFKSKFEFVHFSDAVFRSLSKHSRTDIKHFCFDKVTRQGFLNLKIKDEKLKRYPKLIVFDLNEGKSFKVDVTDQKREHFISVRYSLARTPGVIIGLTKGPPQTVMLYDLQGGRSMGAMGLHQEDRWQAVYNCPTDGFLCLLTAPDRKEIGITRINDSITVREVNLRYSLKTGVGLLEWVNDDYFVVTDSEKFSMAVVLHQKKAKFTVVQKIENVKCHGLMDGVINGATITVLKAFSKGIIVGTSLSLLLVYTLQENESGKQASGEGAVLALQTCVKFSGLDTLSFSSIDINTKESEFLLVFDQSSYAVMSTQGIIRGKYPAEALLKKGAVPALQEIDISFSLVRKNYRPLVDLASGDYSSNLAALVEDQLSLEITNPFAANTNHLYVFEQQTESSQVLCCEMHPFGQFIVCAMRDRLCTFSLTFLNLLPMSENLRIKGTYIMKFNLGGSVLACATTHHKSNIHPIHLVNPFTLEILRSVSTHSHTNTIFHMTFTNLATILWSASVDGYLFMWNIPQMKKTEVLIEKELRFGSMDMYVALSSQGGELSYYMCLLCEDAKGVQSILLQNCEKLDKRQILSLPTSNEHGVPIRHTCVKSVLVTNRCSGLIVGNSSGQVQFFSNPASLIVPSFILQTSASASIDRLFFSSYNNSITVFSSEGQVNVFSLRLPNETSKEQPVPELPDEAMMYREEQSLVLVNNRILAQYEYKEQQKIIELKDLSSKFEFKINEERMQAEENLNLCKNAFEEQIQKKIEECETLKRDREKLKSETVALIRGIENSNSAAVEELERMYEGKINHEGEKLIQLDKEKRTEVARLEERIVSLGHEKSLAVEKTTEIYKTQVQSAASKLVGIENEILNLNKQNEEKLAALQSEHDAIILQIKDTYVTKIRKLEEEVRTLKSDMKEFKRYNEEVGQLNEALEKEAEQANERVAKVEGTVKDLEKALQKANAETLQLHDVITEKDKSLARLKKTIDELEKTKNVLTFRTAEMRKGMEPKELQIDRLKDEVQRLENELESILKRSAEKETMLAKKNDELKSSQVQIGKLISTIADKDVWIKRISGVITNCVQRTDPKMWHVQMKKIYHFVLESERHEDAGFRSPFFQKDNSMHVEEMSTQIHHLQTKIAQQNKMKMKTSAYQMKHIETKTEENATLLSELNELRMAYKKLNSIKTTLHIANGQLVRENKFLQNELKKWEGAVRKTEVVVESCVESEKENRSQTLPTFKIRSINGSKANNTLQIGQDSEINERGRMVESGSK